MVRVFVLGATGMLGHKLCQLLPDQGFAVIGAIRGQQKLTVTRPEVYGRIELLNGIDVLNETSLTAALNSARPDVVVNCVGIVKQKSEAEDRYLSVAINSFLPHQLARWCADHDSRLIHISTDCVFDGLSGSYREADSSNATDLYGKSKYLGETDATETSAVTLRTSIIGRELHDPQHGLLEWFLSQRGLACKGFSKAIYTGFTTHELARVITTVIRYPKLHGLYQVSSRAINKFDLLQFINRSLQTNVSIGRDEQFFCDRSLIMDRFAQETGYVSPSWESMIEELRIDATPYDAWRQADREIEARWLNHAFKSC